VGVLFAWNDGYTGGVWILELVVRFIVCLVFYMLCLLLLVLGLWCVTIVYCWCFVIRVQVVSVFC